MVHGLIKLKKKSVLNINIRIYSVYKFVQNITYCYIPYLLFCIICLPKTNELKAIYYVNQGAYILGGETAYKALIDV